MIYASDELLNVILALRLKVQELDAPGCKLPKNRTMREFVKELVKTVERFSTQEILYYIASDTFFAYERAKEVLQGYSDLKEGNINVEFKDANGMSINNPYYKEKHMSKVDDIIAGKDPLDSLDALDSLDLDGAQANVDAMRSGGGEAIELAPGDNDCGDGCKI